MAMKYQITSIPAMKVFRGGEVVKTVTTTKTKTPSDITIVKTVDKSSPVIFQ